MTRRRSNFVLAYQGADEQRRQDKELFWTGLADVLAYSVVWGAVGALAAGLLGAVLLWGVLLANAAQ
jgi:hypothetical protein